MKPKLAIKQPFKFQPYPTSAFEVPGGTEGTKYYIFTQGTQITFCPHLCHFGWQFISRL